MKNPIVAYLLAIFLYPFGAHRAYMGRSDWWVYPMLFVAGLVAVLSGYQYTTYAILAVLWASWLYDLATMWRWERN